MKLSRKGAIVILSNTHWHHAWQTGNSVAAGFASRGYRVLFVEPIPKRWPRLAETKRVFGRLTGNSVMAGLSKQRLPPGVELLSPLALPDVSWLTKFVNRRLFVPLIAAQIRRQTAVAECVVLVHTLPIQAAIALQKTLKPDLTIYRCVYDWEKDPYSGRQLAERELLQEVDLAWADCEHNLERLQTTRPDVTLMPPAVELSLFENVVYTQSGLPKPLCVYFGTIALSIDMALLEEISRRYHLRLVGPTKVSLDGLAAGTEIVGPVPHEQIPRLIRDADVLLLPYNTRPHMQGVIPAKLFECLATGKPVVATNLTTIDEYRELVYLCNGYEKVFKAIEASQQEDKALAAQRIAIARENSWERRITQMEQALQGIIEERQANLRAPHQR